MFLARIKKTIQNHHLLDAGDSVVVAVSGGPDSVCLLSALLALRDEYKLTLHVAHLDHMFRGEESAEDARFVADLAKKLGIPAAVEAIDVPAFCRERGLSAQAGAREVRYAFLERVATSVKARRIAVAHTANDQAETFLMRLMRGAGTSGLSAIPPKRDRIIRPLIEVTREEVLEHLRENNLDYRSDPSNEKPLYTRNRIRLELLPLFRKFNTRIVETLAAEASLLRDEDDAIEAYLSAIAENAVQQKSDALTVKRGVFNALPAAFRRRLLRMIVERAGADPSSLPLGQTDDALSFMTTARTGRRMELHRGITITREYDRFVFGGCPAVKEFSHELPVPGSLVVPGTGLELTAAVRDQPPPNIAEEPNSLWQAAFDCDKITPPLIIRSRKTGDRFHPAGMGGRSKKLQDYFSDEKVPRSKRDSVPLLCSRDDILWVVGMRTDGRFLAGPGTTRVVVVQVRSTECGVRN